MSLKIRSATDDDEQKIVALWRECGLVTSYNDPVSDFRFAKGGPSSMYWSGWTMRASSEPA